MVCVVHNHIRYDITHSSHKVIIILIGGGKCFMEMGCILKRHSSLFSYATFPQFVSPSHKMKPNTGIVSKIEVRQKKRINNATHSQNHEYGKMTF